MPLPNAKPKEKQQEFMNRCMSDSIMLDDFKDQKQRAAVCYSQYSKRTKNKSDASWDDVRKGDILGLI